MEQQQQQRGIDVWAVSRPADDGAAAAAARGGPVLAKDVMVAPVVTVAEGMSVLEAAAVLTRAGVSGAPVVDEAGYAVGVISERDLLTEVHSHAAPTRLAAGWLAAGAGGGGANGDGGGGGLDEAAAAAAAAVREAWAAGMTARVRDVMSFPVIWAEPDDTAAHVADLMLAHRVNRVPILRGAADRRPVGIVSREDILRAAVLAAAAAAGGEGGAP